MKRIIIAFAAIAAAFSLVSCNKEQIEAPSTELKLNITVANLDGSADTKAAKTSWVAGDKINIWYDENLSQDPDLVIVYDGSKWAVDHNAAVSGNEPAASGKLVAVYVDGSLSDFSYTGDANSCQFNAPRFSSVIDDTNRPCRMPLVSHVERTDYTFASNILAANLSQWLFMGTNVQVVVSGLPEGEWALSCDKFRAPNRLGISNNNPTIRVSVSAPSAYGTYALSVTNKDGKAFMYQYSKTDSDFNFTLFNTATGEKLVYSVSGKSLDNSGNKLNAIKIPFSKFVVEGDYEYVDLGLSVKWATMNIGAKKPEDYGYYFAWGETTEKTYYRWTTEGDYKWGIYDSSASPKYGISKYTASVKGGDGLKTLQPDDDPATVNWGSKWRTPTLDEIKELLDNTKCEWTWDAAKKGYTVKGLKTGNSIFLPAAGYRYGSDLEGDGAGGYYWSSSVDESYPTYACYFYFHSGDHGWNYSYRYYGRSVRAVTE